MEKKLGDWGTGLSAIFLEKDSAEGAGAVTLKIDSR